MPWHKPELFGPAILDFPAECPQFIVQAGDVPVDAGGGRDGADLTIKNACRDLEVSEINWLRVIGAYPAKYPPGALVLIDPAEQAVGMDALFADGVKLGAHAALFAARRRWISRIASSRD